jgi:hypothetical protein
LLSFLFPHGLLSLAVGRSDFPSASGTAVLPPAAADFARALRQSGKAKAKGPLCDCDWDCLSIAECRSHQATDFGLAIMGTCWRRSFWAFSWEGKSNTTKLPLYPTSPIYPHGCLNGGELATEVKEMAQNGSTQFWIRMSSSTTGQKQKPQQDSFETNSILKI